MDVIILIKKEFLHIQIYICEFKIFEYLRPPFLKLIDRNKAGNTISADCFLEKRLPNSNQSLQTFNELYWNCNSANFGWKHFMWKS